jgi:uncharacterized DUF497 family protein
MAITYDPAKREWTLRERGLDFERAEQVFAGPTFDRPDDRRDYGERRIVSFGILQDRMVVLVWTPRGGARHIISMRKANEREQTRYGKTLATYGERIEKD